MSPNLVAFWENIDSNISQTQDNPGDVAGSVRSGQRCWGRAVDQAWLDTDQG